MSRTKHATPSYSIHRFLRLVLPGLALLAQPVLAPRRTLAQCDLPQLLLARLRPDQDLALEKANGASLPLDLSRQHLGD